MIIHLKWNRFEFGAQKDKTFCNLYLSPPRHKWPSNEHLSQKASCTPENKGESVMEPSRSLGALYQSVTTLFVRGPSDLRAEECASPKSSIFSTPLLSINKFEALISR